MLEARGLSVHFLIDLDGTVYQALDLCDQAWHATKANRRSVGVEIAHIGAYPPQDAGVLERWYGSEPDSTRLKLPPELRDAAPRRSGLRLAPARPQLFEGTLNGSTVVQRDFTPEQYESLARLSLELAQLFPRLELRFPRDDRGAVAPDALSDEAFESFQGILGHHHVQTNKVDPGPAFDWEALERRWQALARP